MLNLQIPQAPIALLGLGIFIVAMILVVIEEFTAIRKSKPVVFAAGVLWLLVAIAAQSKGLDHLVTGAIQSYLEEYVQLFLFLFVAITYINTIEERNVFDALRCYLTRKQFTYRQLFWITGIGAFFLSPIIDNMTTALVLCASILAIGKNQPRFVGLACVNIVVAANAGGAFSPFGDITTLMVWQKGVLDFGTFFHLFIPAVVNFLVPAVCMHFAVPSVVAGTTQETIHIKPGGFVITFLFLLTIFTTISFNHYYKIPPALGMMMGFSYLQLFSYYLKLKYNRMTALDENGKITTFDIFELLRRIEWDTLLFFYGVMLCIGALGTLGYLELASNALYIPSEKWNTVHFFAQHQHTIANVLVGILSAIIDNIPLTFAVLTMHPVMSEGQWLLLTLTAGVGGSLLSIGSAAGVALMGQSKGNYTFFSHLRWSWAILLGYGASVITHILINQDFF